MNRLILLESEGYFEDLSTVYHEEPTLRIQVTTVLRSCADLTPESTQCESHLTVYHHHFSFAFVALACELDFACIVWNRDELLREETFATKNRRQ